MTDPSASHGASRSRVATGRPRSPARCTAETNRQIAAQPARPPPGPSAEASKVTRGRLSQVGSRNSPPRTGVRDRDDGRSAVSLAASRDRLVGQVDAEHRPDAGGPAGLRELHRAVGAVTVGQRQGVHLVLGRPLDQGMGVGGAVLERVAGRDVKVDEGVH